MASDGKRSISGQAASSIEPNAKRKRYFCTYQKDWESEFKWIKGSDRGLSNAFCTLCNSHIYIGSSAKSDVIRHAKTQNHLKLVSFQNQSKPISSFLPGANSTLNDKAETLFSNFVAEHNLLFAISYHFTKLCKKMFTVSEIAKGFACGRTKTHLISWMT